MFGLIAVMIFFMFRNGKKRQRAQQEMQSKTQPGAEVMLQSGIFGTLVEIDEEANRATISTGTSTIVVHRNAIAQVITPVDEDVTPADNADIAPDDDPQFGERVASADAPAEAAAATEATEETPEASSNDENGTEPNTKA